MSDFAEHTDHRTLDDVHSDFSNNLANTPIALAFSGVANLLNFDSSECPIFSIDLTDTIIGVNASTTIHCEIMNDHIKPILSLVMTIIFIFIGFRILASA